MAGVFTGGMAGGLLHFGWSLSRLLCWGDACKEWDEGYADANGMGRLWQ